MSGGWRTMASTLAEAVADLQRRYFEALEVGAADHLGPDPRYKWRYYQGDMTVTRMREALARQDAYRDDQQQVTWASNTDNMPYQAGPGLSRLPDGAIVAMFQGLDALFFEHYKGPHT